MHYFIRYPLEKQEVINIVTPGGQRPAANGRTKVIYIPPAITARVAHLRKTRNEVDERPTGAENGITM